MTVVTVPKDTWVILDAKQAKQLQNSQQKQNNAGTQQEQKKVMQQLASNYKKQNPEASQQQVKDYLNDQKQTQATKQIKQEIGK